MWLWQHSPHVCLRTASLHGIFPSRADPVVFVTGPLSLPAQADLSTMASFFERAPRDTPPDLKTLYKTQRQAWSDAKRRNVDAMPALEAKARATFAKIAVACGRGAAEIMNNQERDLVIARRCLEFGIRHIDAAVEKKRKVDKLLVTNSPKKAKSVSDKADVGTEEASDRAERGVMFESRRWCCINIIHRFQLYPLSPRSQVNASGSSGDSEMAFSDQAA